MLLKVGQAHPTFQLTFVLRILAGMLDAYGWGYFDGIINQINFTCIDFILLCFSANADLF